MKNMKAGKKDLALDKQVQSPKQDELLRLFFVAFLVKYNFQVFYLALTDKYTQCLGKTKMIPFCPANDYVYVE